MAEKCTGKEVWIINPFDDPPGAGIPRGRYWSLAEALVARGHRVVWWTSVFSHRFKRRREPGQSCGFVVRQVRCRPYATNVSWSRVLNLRDFGRELGRAVLAELKEGPGPDRVICSLPPITAGLVCAQLVRPTGARFVVDIQDLWPETFERLLPLPGRLRGALAPALLRFWSKRADRLLAQADALSAVAERYLLRGMRVNASPARRVTYLGASVPVAAAEERPGPPRRLVYLGSLSRSYDVGVLVPALRRLRDRGFAVHLDILSGDRACEALRREVAAAGLADRVSFAGFLTGEALASRLREADVALNPVRPESLIALPNKVGDYLVSGLPIMNSLEGELATLLEQERAGLRYTAGDPASLAAAVERYATDAGLWREHRVNALALGRRSFDRSVTYPQLAEWLVGL